MSFRQGAHRAGASGLRSRAVLRGIALALLLGESVVILVPSVYGTTRPMLFGFPFFYWFQLLWIIVGMVVTGIAYLLWQRADALELRTAHNGRGGTR